MKYIDKKATHNPEEPASIFDTFILQRDSDILLASGAYSPIQLSPSHSNQDS